MATKFKVGDKAKIVFAKNQFPDAVAEDGTVIYSVGADDKEYTGEIVLVQDNGYSTVEFIKDGEPRQVSLPTRQIKKV